MCWSQSVVREFSASLFLRTRVVKFGLIEFQWTGPSISLFILITTYQSHDEFWDVGWKRVSVEGSAGRNIIPLPLSNRYFFFHEKNTGSVGIYWLLRTRFLDAGLLQLCRTKFTFFCNGSFHRVIPYLWDWVLVLDEVPLPRSGSFLGTPLTRNFCPSLSWRWYLNFNSMIATKLYNMNLKNWSNYCSFSNGSKESGIRVRTRVWKLSACWSSISKTIVHISNSFVAHSHRNSKEECCILTNSCKLDFFPQRLKILNAFSQSVSRCGLIVPWSLHQRIHCLRSHFFQYLIIVCLRKLFWSFITLQTKLFTPAGNCCVDKELICWVDRLSLQSSAFEASAVKCMVSLLFFLFRFPRHKALMLLNTGWPDSWNRYHHLVSRGFPFSFRKHNFEFHTISIHSPSPRNVQCPCENLFA